MQWNSGPIMKMGWSVSEDLLFVRDDGVVLVYDLFLNFERTFSMGQVTELNVHCLSLYACFLNCELSLWIYNISPGEISECFFNPFLYKFFWCLG